MNDETGERGRVNEFVQTNAQKCRKRRRKRQRENGLAFDHERLLSHLTSASDATDPLRVLCSSLSPVVFAATVYQKLASVSVEAHGKRKARKIRTIDSWKTFVQTSSERIQYSTWFKTVQSLESYRFSSNDSLVLSSCIQALQNAQDSSS